ncbi:hypothetical protein OUZ56_001615 [Daphnia magna]|uniref:Uncharacterized protein n=1 Tax=Daphnia magna TaxID=35525 RepID=A0ABR0A379_9CRUS|nr:hypothetical protein OUZ56_001615 [Daphnia magna]
MKSPDRHQQQQEEDDEKKNGKGPVQTDTKRPKGNRIGSGGAPVCFVTFTCGQLRQPQQSSNREMVTPHICINNGPNSEKYERKKNV